MHIIPSTVPQSRYAEEVDMKIWIHADDYGITTDQALSILALSSSCGGTGALNSVSAFANSPAFQESAQFARPFVESKALSVSVHINLVEGPCVSDPSTVPLLVNERGTFAHDFAGLVKLGKWETREAAYEQVKRECIAQIERFLQAFPTEQRALNVDSHQHVHMIPFVFDALVDAAQSLGCHIDYLRIPVEPVTPVGLRRAFSANGVKNLILNHYAKRNLRLMPAGANRALFSGVMLSGHMQDLTYPMLNRLISLARTREQNLEVLFHPVSVPHDLCLDPLNGPFTAACASPNRDAEALRIAQLEPIVA